MGRVILIILIFISQGILFSQGNYSFPEKFNPIYNFKPSEAHLKLMSSPEAVTDKENFESFLIDYVYQDQFTFDNNEIYMDWPEAEVYLLKVFDSIIPRKIDRRNLNIFIARNPEENAYASRFGFVFFNIGMLARIKSEAVLADIIAHEAGHYLFKHNIKKAIMDHNLFDYSSRFDYGAYETMYGKSREYEIQSDNFAAGRLIESKYSLQDVYDHFESMDLKTRMQKYSIRYKSLTRISDMSDKKILSQKNKNFSMYDTHPLDIERLEIIKKAMSKCVDCKKSFVVDSAMFMKIKQVAREECKKICFEKCQFKNCIRYCILDYLLNPKKVKNLYMLTECLRRVIYAKPELAKKPLLTENMDWDKELFYYNKGILYKPDYLFEDEKQARELGDHPFFTDEKKPFNTYGEAFLFFAREALKYNLNEVNMSLGLYYRGLNQDDSAKKYFESYIGKGSGLYLSMAKDILEKGQPTLGNSKLLVMTQIDNYTGFGYNYYYTMNNKVMDSTIKVNLDAQKDCEFISMNELRGAEPKKLNECQKLQSAIFTLYNKEDRENLEQDFLMDGNSEAARLYQAKINKNLLVYSPELYNWFNQNEVGKLFFIYSHFQYKEYLKGDLFASRYFGYYMNTGNHISVFKTQAKSAKKMSEAEVAKDALLFLNKKAK